MKLYTGLKALRCPRSLLNSYNLLIITRLNALWKSGEDFNGFQAFSISLPCWGNLKLFNILISHLSHWLSWIIPYTPSDITDVLHAQLNEISRALMVIQL